MVELDCFSGNERLVLLMELRARALAQGVPARMTFSDGSGLKVQASADTTRLLVWTGTERSPAPRLLEDIGEDAGLYEPTTRPWSCSESVHSVLIFEGLAAPPCRHDWGLWTHYDAKSESGNSGTCTRCGVKATSSVARRGHREEYGYDTWALRPHIWRRWMQLGPVPGSLSA